MSYAHYYDLDTQPTVNPATLIDLPAPWARKRRSTWADYAFTSEYDRQFTWKFPIPRGKVNEATETEELVRPPQTSVIYGTVPDTMTTTWIKPSRLPRPTIEREEATQTMEMGEESRATEATQTGSPYIVAAAVEPTARGKVTEATQTTAGQIGPAQVASVATSPLRPTAVHRVRDEATETEEEPAVPTVRSLVSCRIHSNRSLPLRSTPLYSTPLHSAPHHL